MFSDNYVGIPGMQHAGSASAVFNRVNDFDPGRKRPYFDDHDRPAVKIRTGRTTLVKGVQQPVIEKVLISNLAARGIFDPVWNATSLRKDEWIEMDRKVLLTARARLRAAADLAASATYGGFNGMAVMTLEYEAMSDPGEAIVDMYGTGVGRNDMPLFKLRSMPLPITYSDFQIPQRKLLSSRRGGSPLDMTLAEACGRRVGETVEKTVIGVTTGLTYGTQAAGNYAAHDGTSTVYGYINHTARLTKTDLTVPTGANPEATVADVLTMRQSLMNNNFYGPYMLYHSTDWDLYLDRDYAFTAGATYGVAPTKTLRQRIREIEGIQDVRRLDYLTPAASHAFTLVMVQMTSDVAEFVDGMGITTMQWAARPDIETNFRVQTIQAPRLRHDYSNQCGILHARTA